MQTFIPTLALSEAWTFGLFALQIVIGIVQMLILFWLRGNRDQMGTLKSEVKQHAQQLIDQRFTALTEKLDGISDRLNRGDDKFERQHDRDHQLELKFLQSIESLRVDLAERFATKDDVAALRREIQSNKS
ncbi:MAG: hypothetical protein AAGF84_03830 [Planctomycetota bacterium]